MSQKPLPLIIAVVLLGILSIILFINRQAIHSEYVQLEERYKSLGEENRELTQRFSKSEDERRRLSERMEVIERNLDKTIRERDEYRSKFEVASKEKEELIEKLRTVPRVVTPSKEVTFSKGVTLPREDIYWATVLKEKASLELQVSGLKSEISELKNSLEKTNREKLDLELDLKGQINQILDLERQLKHTDQLASSLSSDLVIEKEDKRALSEQIKLVKEENTLLKRRLNQSESQGKKLEDKLEKTESERSLLERRLAEIEKILKKRIEELAETRREMKEIITQAKEISPEEAGQVELPPIVVRPLGVPVASAPSVLGKVISTNRDHNFVIIDLGEDQGVRAGRTFEVFREDRFIGRLEVIQTRSSVSAADIKEKTVDIKAGDIVR